MYYNIAFKFINIIATRSPLSRLRENRAAGIRVETLDSIRVAAHVREQAAPDGATPIYTFPISAGIGS